MSTISHRDRRERFIERIITRDGDGCFYCGVSFSAAINFRRTLDHFIPKSQGGRSSFANLRLACFGCNKKKSDLTECEFFETNYFRERMLWVERQKRKDMGLHPTKDTFWHPGKKIVKIDGSLSCQECGTTSSATQRLDSLPCLAAQRWEARVA